jgi:hypothetical protein
LSDRLLHYLWTFGSRPLRELAQQSAAAVKMYVLVRSYLAKAQSLILQRLGCWRGVARRGVLCAHARES